MMNLIKSSILILIISSLLSILSSCSKAPELDPKEAINQSFNSFKEVVKTNDWAEMVNWMTQETQDTTVTLSLIFGVQSPQKMKTGLQGTNPNPEFTKVMKNYSNEIDQILKKHKLTHEDFKTNEVFPTEDEIKAISKKIKDKGSFANDLFKASLKLSNPQTANQNMFSMWKDASLSDLKIDGDQASAKLNIMNMKPPISFKKVNGEWLIHMPQPAIPN